MKPKQPIAILLLLAMLCTLFASCASEDQTKTPANTTETTAAPVDSGDAVETELNYLDSLPTIDFGNEDFVILCRDEKLYEVWAETEVGETINDAVFRRNKTVEEKYNVIVSANEQPGGWNDQTTFMGLIKNSVNAQDGAYDLVAGYMAYSCKLAVEGMFYNLYDVNNLDLSNPWWTQGFIENNTIKDCTFMALGDLSLTMWEGIYALYFNKQLAEDYGCGDLYQIVKDKKWTLSAFEELVKKVSGDIDGDSRFTKDDLYGFVTNNHTLRAMVTTSNLPLTERNDEGTYDLVYYNENLISLYDQIYNILYSGDNCFVSKPTNDWDYTEMMKMFTEDRALFISGTLDNTTVLRQMDTDFGILPLPMSDAGQEDYISHSYDGLSIFAVPASVKNPDMSGAILEALCAESAQTVVPEFYETVLKSKVARDNDSELMLDILRQNLRFDFGFVHSQSLDSLFSMFGDQLRAKTAKYASSYEAKRKSIEKKFADLLEAYTEITD